MAIAEAVRPASEEHYQGIECIIGKLVKHHGWTAPPADNTKWSTPAEIQPVLASDGGRTLDQLLPDRPDTDQMSALELSLEPASSRQLVELPVPYAISEDDRHALREILHGLPPLRYPISDDKRAAFLDAWFDLNERPLWEPILMTVADIERYGKEQKEIQRRHQQVLRDEFARGQPFDGFVEQTRRVSPTCVVIFGRSHCNGRVGIVRKLVHQRACERRKARFCFRRSGDVRAFHLSRIATCLTPSSFVPVFRSFERRAC